MSWVLSSRNFKQSTYCDGHGGYLVIKHDRGICNELYNELFSKLAFNI